MNADEACSRRTALGPAAGTALTALIVRAAYLEQIRPAPVFGLLIGDASRYLAWGRAIAAGDWIGTETFYQAPLYPYFLGVITRLWGDDLLVIKAVQIALGSIACGALAFAASRLAGVRVGWIAGLLLALYPPAIFSDALIQKSALDLVLTALFLAVIAEIQIEPRLRRCALAGAVLGALALARENSMVWAPALLLWLLLAYGWKDGGRRGAVLLAAFVAVLLPVALRNLAVGGEFHVTTSGFGPNFYIGNRHGASGVYEPLVFGRGSAEFERADAFRLAEQASGRTLTAGEVSRYWASQTLREIGETPSEWLALMQTKTLLYLSDTERMDTEDQYTFASASSLLEILDRVWGFGVLLALACFGAVVTWTRHPEQRVLWLLAAVYSVTVIAFFVTGRYRLPVVLPLMLPAALGLCALPSLVLERDWSRLGAGLGAAAAIAALSFLPLAGDPRLDPNLMQASTSLNVGLMKGRAGEVQASEHALREAIALHPEYALAHQALAQLLVATGRRPEAIRAYHRAIEIKPDYAAAHDGLGELLLRDGRVDEAILHFEQAIAADPEASAARAHLQRARVQRDRSN